jgi:hypothetical protein
MRLAIALLVAASTTMSGCKLFNRGEKPVLTPEQKYLFADDQTLPAGIVGQPYDAAIAIHGGDPPYHFSPADKKIPVGLSVNEQGHLVGIPAEAGQFTFQLTAGDSAGRQTLIQISLSIVLEPQSVRCGDTVSGHFDGSAYDVDGVDLTDLPNLAWLAVEMPQDLTTRVELKFANSSVTTLYVEKATEVVGDGNLTDHYVPFYLNPGYTDMSVPLDAGTEPSLTGYLTQPTIPMVLVGEGTGNWSMTVECTDGPIFVELPQYPTRLGDPLEIDYNVFGDNTGVRIWTDDPLPDWMIWDESTGTVTGTAMEPGAWEFDINAETSDGRKRTERSIIGVYAVQDLECDTPVPLDTEEGYLDGEFYAFYDPRGFGVYRVPLAGRSVSSMTLRVEGADGHYLGLSMPNPDWLRFYGGAERLYLTDPVVEIPVDPHSYPAIDDYLDPAVGELYFSAGSIGSDYSMTVTVDCDEGPRPNLAGLPVIEPLQPNEYQLGAVGGTPPYSWSATGLPSGISLDPSGLLFGQTGAIGTYDVDLTVVDKLGKSFTDHYPLYVGDDEACAGYKLMTCGDSLDDKFSTAYYNDGNGKDSTKVFCYVNHGDTNLGWEIYSDNGQLRVDVADPGVSAEEMFDNGLGTYVNYVDYDSSIGVPLDPFSWPNLDDYPGLPVLVAIRAYVGGSWTVHLACDAM